MCFVVFCGVLCFVVFCGCFVVFCGCFAVFCQCFAVFPQNTQNTRNTSKILKNTKNAQYARVLRAFSKIKKIRLYCTKHFSQNICKTPQNTAKLPQNAFCEITSQNTAKKRKTLKKVTKRSQYNRNTYRAHSVYSSKIL